MRSVSRQISLARTERLSQIPFGVSSLQGEPGILYQLALLHLLASRGWGGEGQGVSQWCHAPPQEDSWLWGWYEVSREVGEPS